MLVERHGMVEITAIQRQRVDWQRDATTELATHAPRSLERCRRSGSVVVHERHEDAQKSLVERWAEARRYDRSSIILAYTRDDVRDLNQLAREQCRATGKLGNEIDVMASRGERSFAVGDRVMFLRNERDLGVKNGTLGTISRVAEHAMFVTLDGQERPVAFNLNLYNDIDHGYAATIHKAQGVTVDRAYVLASQHMDRHASYVALSRHRDGVELHYGRDEFVDDQQFARTLARERLKESVLDFSQVPGDEPRSSELLNSAELPTRQNRRWEGQPGSRSPRREQERDDGLEL